MQSLVKLKGKFLEQGGNDFYRNDNLAQMKDDGGSNILGTVSKILDSNLKIRII